MGFKKLFFFGEFFEKEVGGEEKRDAVGGDDDGVAFEEAVDEPRDGARGEKQECAEREVFGLVGAPDADDLRQEGERGAAGGENADERCEIHF